MKKLPVALGLPFEFQILSPRIPTEVENVIMEREEKYSKRYDVGTEMKACNTSVIHHLRPQRRYGPKELVSSLLEISSSSNGTKWGNCSEVWNNSLISVG